MSVKKVRKERKKETKRASPASGQRISVQAAKLSNAGSRISILLPQRSSARDQYRRIGSTICHCGCGVAALIQAREERHHVTPA